MRRGEVWWARIPKPVGTRPVVLLTRDAAIRVRTRVTVAVVTQTVRGIPVEVPLGTADGMPKPCVVNTDVLQTIPKDVLLNRVTVLSSARLAAVGRAVRFALALNE